MELAARHAFWNLDRADLEEVAASVGCDISGISSLFDVCFALIKTVLERSDETALELLHQRIVSLEKTMTCEQELLQVVEAGQCLVAADQEDLKKLAEEGPRS